MQKSKNWRGFCFTAKKENSFQGREIFKGEGLRMSYLYECRVYDASGNLKRVVTGDELKKSLYDTDYGGRKKTFNKIPSEKKERYDELQSLGGDEKECGSVLGKQTGTGKED